MLNIKQDFPIFAQKIHGQPLVYLDSSSSSQKPQSVIDALSHYYQQDHANVHRGIYELSTRATRLYEETRKRIQGFINAAKSSEIIFTRGTTESINLVANSFGREFKKGDEVIVSVMEHHSNIVPWQTLGVTLKVIPMLPNGELDLVAFGKLFSKRTKLLALSHASNVLGTINPVKEMIALSHAHQVPVLLDGAQAFPHLPVDVQDLDCDFYAFSAHKAYGPTGVGVLYGKKALLEQMPPYQSGGSMIETVTFEQSTFCPLPHKFEAGTPSIASVVAFNAALTLLEKIGMHTIQKHEKELLDYTLQGLQARNDIQILGQPHDQLGVISFVMDQIHPHDIATILDHQGICVRAGHHCAMPLMSYLQIPACVRISFGVYNSKSDIDAFFEGLNNVKSVFTHV